MGADYTVEEIPANLVDEANEWRDKMLEKVAEFDDALMLSLIHISQFGGPRFGEMEVWALEAFGAAHIDVYKRQGIKIDPKSVEEI